MAYVSDKATYIFSEYSASLANGAEIDSGWIDYESVDKYQVEVLGDAVGLTFVTDSSNVSGGGEADVNTSDATSSTFFLFNAITRQRYIRVKIVNNTGVAVTNACLSIKQTFGSSDKLSVFPANVDPTPFSQAALVQAILRGQDTNNNYRSVQVNEAGAILIADFGTEVARGIYAGYGVHLKFGKNSSIGIGTTPEDVWNGGGLYTGFDCIVAETLETNSADANDTGSLVSSGTATAGSMTSITDSGATFIADGVAVGDLLMNDTQGVHGIISVVDSETVLTVYRMADGADPHPTNEIGDAYRVATSTSTGAAVVKLLELLDSSYVESSEYIILNGSTRVDTTGTYLRHSKGQVILAGSTSDNEGEINTRQKTTTANVTMVMPALAGQSAIGCATVPAGKTWIIKSIAIQMGRGSGAAGSANCSFQTREIGSAWQSKRLPTITNSNGYNELDIGGIVIQEFTDIKWEVMSVSDNDTIVSGEFEYFEIDV